MSLLKTYLQNFIARAGSRILASTIIARGLSFIASWISLQLIPNKELGRVLFAYNIILFLIPFGGFGLHQSLLRFGALLKTQKEKNSLFRYVFFKGIGATCILIAVLGCLISCINFQFEQTGAYVLFLSLSLPSMYVFELLKIQLRLEHKNRTFAATDIVFAAALAVNTLVFSYVFQEKGYAFALVFTPVCTILIYFKKLQLYLKKHEKPCIHRSFWSYGIFASLSNVVTQLLFVIDILLIGHLLNNAEMVTNYKYVSLIPLSLLFLPRAFINADFVAFTENIHRKSYIYRYVKSYLLLFTLISAATCVFFYSSASFLLGLFDTDFKQFEMPFLIIVFGVCGVLILRGLFGNLLSSIGKARVNFYISSVALLLNIMSNYVLIPNYGITGAAITSAILMWSTGLASALLFWRLYNKDFLSTP